MSEYTLLQPLTMKILTFANGAIAGKSITVTKFSTIFCLIFSGRLLLPPFSSDFLIALLNQILNCFCQECESLVFMSCKKSAHESKYFSRPNFELTDVNHSLHFHVCNLHLSWNFNFNHRWPSVFLFPTLSVHYFAFSPPWLKNT